MNFSRLVIVTILLVFAWPAGSREVNWEDILSVSSYARDLNRNRDSKVIAAISNQKNPEYAQSFLAGMLHKSKRSYGYSIRWLARSYYADPTYLPEDNSLATIIKYLGKSRSKSPIYEQSLYEIAVCYLLLNQTEAVTRILELLPPDTDQRLSEDLLALRAENLEKQGQAMLAEELFLKLAATYPYSANFLKTGGFYHRRLQIDQALKYYFRALLAAGTDTAYTAASSQIMSLVAKDPGLEKNLSELQKCRLAEGYRLMQQLPESLLYWKKIDTGQLDSAAWYFYLQNYSRLLLQLRQFSAASNLVQSHLNKIDNSRRDSLLADLSRRLFAMGQYHLLLELVPAYQNYAEAQYYRILAMVKLKMPERRKEADYFLENHASSARQIEDIYFSFCMEDYRNRDLQQAEKCLKKMISSSSDSESSGRANYYLGRLYEDNQKPEEARQFYRNVYLNAPSSFYTFKALEKAGNSGPTEPPPGWLKTQAGNEEHYEWRAGNPADKTGELRQWLSRNAGNPEALQLYFRLKQALPGYGVDPFWADWEKSLAELENNLTAEQKKGILFMVMGYSARGLEYLGRNQDESMRYLIYQKMGILTDHARNKSVYSRLYLQSKKKDIDPFFLSPLAGRVFYPTPYLAEVKKASEKTGVEPARIYALMKQESNFQASIKSSAGAVGLMQVMPKTGRDVNRALKIKHMNLQNPEHSVLLGATYFKYMLKSQNSFEMAAAAYNAGPGRLAEWGKVYEGYTDEMLLEVIPNRETFHYVRITRENYDIYNIIFSFPDYFFKDNPEPEDSEEPEDGNS